MIADKIKNIDKYKQVLPHSNRILDYLSKTDLANLSVGRYPIEGSDAYCLIQEYNTKSESEKKWESHKKYIDIQIVIEGGEYMGYHPVSDLPVTDPYCGEKDVILYGQPNVPNGILYAAKDFFCVFFPEDGHKPGYHLENEIAVKKAVIKVPCE